MSNLTQPICGKCYQKLFPDRTPLQITREDENTCCQCGEITKEGIFIRIDPATVPFPREKK